jgi:hypothetical protein
MSHPSCFTSIKTQSYCIGSWVGSRPDLDGCRKFYFTMIWSLEFPANRNSLYQLCCWTVYKFITIVFHRLGLSKTAGQNLGDSWVKWSSWYCGQYTQKSWRLCLINQNGHFAHPGKLAGCTMCSAWWYDHIFLSYMRGLKGPEMSSLRFYFTRT